MYGQGANAFLSGQDVASKAYKLRGGRENTLAALVPSGVRTVLKLE